jgi:predicted RNA-binding protein with PIN domain
MLFLVDGYNVTRSDPDTKHLGLEAQRDALVRRLRVRGARMLGAGRIVVLFDGVQGAGASTTEASPVTVVYSRSETADDAIVRIVRGSSEQIVVVSNDVGLIERVRAHARSGVQQRASSACYEGAGRGPKRGARRGGIARDSGLPKGANEITRELKDLWLNDDE